MFASRIGIKNQKIYLGIPAALVFVAAFGLVEFAPTPTKAEAQTQTWGTLKVVTYVDLQNGGSFNDARGPYQYFSFDCVSPSSLHTFSANPGGSNTPRTNANGEDSITLIPDKSKCEVKFDSRNGLFSLAKNDQPVKQAVIQKGKVATVTFSVGGDKGAYTQGIREIPHGASIIVNSWIDNQNGGGVLDKPAAMMGQIRSLDPTAKCIYFSYGKGIVETQRSRDPVFNDVVAQFVTSQGGISGIARCTPGQYTFFPYFAFSPTYLIRPYHDNFLMCPANGFSMTLQDGVDFVANLAVQRSALHDNLTYNLGYPPNFNITTCAFNVSKKSLARTQNAPALLKSAFAQNPLGPGPSAQNQNTPSMIKKEPNGLNAAASQKILYGNLVIKTYVDAQNGGSINDIPAEFFASYNCYPPKKDNLPLLWDHNVNTGANGTYTVTGFLPDQTNCIVSVNTEGRLTLSPHDTNNKLVVIKAGQTQTVHFSIAKDKGVYVNTYKAIPKGGSLYINSWIDRENGGTQKDMPASMWGAVLSSDPKAKCITYGQKAIGWVTTLPSNTMPYKDSVSVFITDQAGYSDVSRCSPGQYYVAPYFVLSSGYLTASADPIYFICPLHNYPVTITDGQDSEIDVYAPKSKMFDDKGYHLGYPPNFSSNTCSYHLPTGSKRLSPLKADNKSPSLPTKPAPPIAL